MSDQQEFGWLDELFDKYVQTLKPFKDNSPTAYSSVKAAIQARFTAQLDKQLMEQESRHQEETSKAEVHHLKMFEIQAKQQQAELLRACKEATEANNDLHKRHEDNLTVVHRIELLRARIETNKEILKFIPALQKHSGASWQRGYVSAQQTLRNNIKKNIAYLQTELVKLQDELTKMEDEK